MDTQIVYAIIAIVALLIVGTFISASEMAFASLNRARIKYMAENGNKRAKAALKLHDRFDELISTLLICNNGVAITTATISAFLFLTLMGEVGPVVSSIVITIIIVVFTDDFPKSMAKHNSEKVALFATPIVRILIVILKPFNFILVKCKARINASFAAKNNEDDDEIHGFPGEELLYVVEEAEQEGTISEDVSQRISNAIEFSDLAVENILTPRVNIVGLPKDCTIDEAMKVFVDNEFSRLPVYDGNMDNIVGIIHIKDFMLCAAGKADSISDVISPAVYTALVTKVPELLKILQNEKKHMAIVADEHSGTDGLVTMDDILKQLVGDILDEHDEQSEDFIPLGDRKYKVFCTADIYKMFDYFEIKDDSSSTTVGGWIIEALGRIPEKGDSFTFKNLAVTVTSVSPKQAIECLIEVLPEDEEE